MLPCVEPGVRGELLTTGQMAERLGIAPKTLLKHKAAGVVRPALQRGKLIRWRGDEATRARTALSRLKHRFESRWCRGIRGDFRPRSFIPLGKDALIGNRGPVRPCTPL